MTHKLLNALFIGPLVAAKFFGFALHKLCEIAIFFCHKQPNATCVERFMLLFQLKASPGRHQLENPRLEAIYGKNICRQLFGRFFTSRFEQISQESILWDQIVWLLASLVCPEIQARHQSHSSVPTSCVVVQALGDYRKRPDRTRDRKPGPEGP